MKRFDSKSTVLGFAAGMIAMLCLGATSNLNDRPGRFQMGSTDTHAFVLDTATGKVWHGYFNSHGGNTDGDFYSPKLKDK